MKKIFFTIVLLAVISLSYTTYAQPLAGGRAFSLAVCDNGAVRSWGYNANGQLVYQSEITDQKTVIDLSGQPAGLFFVQIDSGKKRISEKIILQ